MFERFTHEARQVVIQAQQDAREHRVSHIGTEHLLLGLLADVDGAAGLVLARAGVRPADVRAAIGRLAGPDRGRDAAMLQSIGIDLDQVRAAVEESFGPGALDRCRSPRRMAGGHRPFSPRAKKVLELSLREALRLGHKHIGPEHILLGILREGGGLAALILTERGIELAELRRRVLIALGEAA
ncbi:hypothetical protein BH20ACT5_BH20ACT5_24170 [soil metagenome]